MRLMPLEAGEILGRDFGHNPEGLVGRQGKEVGSRTSRHCGNHQGARGLNQGRYLRDEVMGAELKNEGTGKVGNR